MIRIERERLMFIVNPGAGVGDRYHLASQIRSLVDSSRFDTSFHLLSGTRDVREVCRRSIEEGFRTLIAVGGDGTVNLVASVVRGTGAKMGIVPAGSGNGLARHLGIPLQLARALEVIQNGRTRKIDTGLVNGRLFVNLAGVGFDAAIASRFARSRIRGFFGYLRIALTIYPRYRQKKYRLEVNGRTIRTRALLITFANSDQFGYNTTIAPHARVDDGLLDICILRKPPMLQLPLLAGMMYSGTIERSRYIEVMQSPEVILKMGRNRNCNIDGDPVKLGKLLKVSIEPGSLDVIVP
ncbi:MAG: diacylglycerol kinase family lipid kinase [Bacteroidales bacterium]|nr:diacylglycerol kinase family lipid kinase [Bacteroidales bacterium]